MIGLWSSMDIGNYWQEKKETSKLIVEQKIEAVTITWN